MEEGRGHPKKYTVVEQRTRATDQAVAILFLSFSRVPEESFDLIIASYMK